MRALVGVLAFVLGLVLATVAHAKSPPPSPERLKAAAEEYDAGRRAYIDGRWAEAAEHFENAYHDAPAPAALRGAIRAHRKARQFDRAATLAALGRNVYSDDEGIQKLSTEILDTLGPHLFHLRVECKPACSIAVDRRVVSFSDEDEIEVFVKAGEHELVASFGDDRVVERTFTAKKGGDRTFTLKAPPPKKSAPPEGGPGVGQPPPDKAQKTKPLSPWVFGVAAGLTAVAGGITIWSGIDTLNNPGTDAVRRDCAGQDESCPTYQAGLDAERRTNLLIGTTAGLGVVSAAIGLFFTDWGGSKRPPTSEQAGAWRLELGPTHGGANVGFATTF